MAKFPGKLIQERDRTKRQGILLRVCWKIIIHTRRRNEKLNFKKNTFFSYSIVLHVMYVDILPIATILITYCLFYLFGLPIG